MQSFLKNHFIRHFSVGGFGRALIGNNKEKLVKNLCEGDNLLTPLGPAKIMKVIKKDIPLGYLEMVELNKMQVTPEHPVYMYDEWVLAQDIQKVAFVKCSTVYSFILDKHHIMTVNGNNISTF